MHCIGTVCPQFIKLLILEVAGFAKNKQKKGSVSKRMERDVVFDSYANICSEQQLIMLDMLYMTEKSTGHTQSIKA